MKPRLKGHRLFPGSYAYAVRQQRLREKAHAAGPAVCECGAWSPNLPSEIDRAAWHDRHVTDVISGKAALL
jgi:hypothetical protein